MSALFVSMHVYSFSDSFTEIQEEALSKKATTKQSPNSLVYTLVSFLGKYIFLSGICALPVYFLAQKFFSIPWDHLGDVVTSIPTLWDSIPWVYLGEVTRISALWNSIPWAYLGEVTRIPTLWNSIPWTYLGEITKIPALWNSISWNHLGTATGIPTLWHSIPWAHLREATGISTLKTVSIPWPHIGIAVGISILRGILQPDHTLKQSSATLAKTQKWLHKLALIGILSGHIVFAILIPSPINIATAFGVMAISLLNTYNDRALANYIRKFPKDDRVYHHDKQVDILYQNEQADVFSQGKQIDISHQKETKEIPPLAYQETQVDVFYNMAQLVKTKENIPRLHRMRNFFALRLISSLAMIALYTLAPLPVDPLKRSLVLLNFFNWLVIALIQFKQLIKAIHATIAKSGYTPPPVSYTLGQRNCFTNKIGIKNIILCIFGCLLVCRLSNYPNTLMNGKL